MWALPRGSAPLTDDQDLCHHLAHAFHCPCLGIMPLPWAVGRSSLFPFPNSGHREARTGQDVCQTQTLIAWHNQWPMFMALRGAQEAEGSPALWELGLVQR